MLSNELLKKYNELMGLSDEVLPEEPANDLEASEETFYIPYLLPTETLTELKGQASIAAAQFQAKTQDSLSRIYNARKIRDLHSKTKEESKKQRLLEIKAQLQAKLIEESIANATIKYIEESEPTTLAVSSTKRL